MGGGYRGWADRFAEHLAALSPACATPTWPCAGRPWPRSRTSRFPQAIAFRPDLVSLAAGGNDMLRPGADPDALAESFDEVIRTLLQAGCPVLMFTGFDPRFPVLRLIRGKVAAFNMHLRAIADRHQCQVVNLWSMNVLRDPRAWSADRLHMTSEGHRRVALRACEVMGVPVEEDWREPWPPLDRPAPLCGGGLAVRAADGCPLGAGVRRAVAEPPDPRPFLRRRDTAQAPAVAAAGRSGRAGRSRPLGFGAGADLLVASAFCLECPDYGLWAL